MGTTLDYPQFQLKLPEGWGDTTVATLACSQSESNYLANVRIEVSPIPLEATLRDCVDREMETLKRAPLKGLKFHRDESLPVGGEPGSLLEFTYFQDPPPSLGLETSTMKFRQRVYFRHGSGALMRLVCTDADEAFGRHEGDFECVAQSFVWQGMPGGQR